MNYLTELLAFYRWLESSGVNPLLQAFWHLLMFFNNKAAVQSEAGKWYWPVVFKAPNSEICRFLGLTSRFQVNSQRKHLIRHGRIDYTPHVSQHAGDYRIKPFDTGLCEVEISVMDTGKKRLVWTQGVTRSPRQAAPFINSVNHKQASFEYCNQESPANIHGFNLLPPLTDSEADAIKALYPDDELAAFEAMWGARERKAIKEKVEG